MKQRVIVLVICFLLGCKSKPKESFKLFFPTLLEQSYFKEKGIDRISGIDLDLYSVTKSDTTIIYEYQERLLCIYWEFPFVSEKELLEIFDNGNQMLLTPLDNCDDNPLNNYFFLKNNDTGHIFMGQINLVSVQKTGVNIQNRRIKTL